MFAEEKMSPIKEINATTDIAYLLGVQVCERRVIANIDGAEAVSLLPSEYNEVCQIIAANGMELAVAPNRKEAFELAKYAVVSKYSGSVEVQPAAGRTPTIVSFEKWLDKRRDK